MLHAAKTALVTGGAKRLGRAIVLDLARHGFAVAIHCNGSRAEADELANGILKEGGRAHVVQADLSDTNATAGIVGNVQSALGPLGLVVNNASVFEDDTVTDFDEAVWEGHFAVHLKAPTVIAGSFARSLAPDAAGMIVNLIDQRVWRLTPRFFSYTLSKAALWTATQTMAQALAPRIRVNAIGPGPTLASERQDPKDFERQQEALILRHGPALAEFGATIRYLWETPSITGQMVALDGGQHLAWQTPDVAGVAE